MVGYAFPPSNRELQRSRSGWNRCRAGKNQAFYEHIFKNQAGGRPEKGWLWVLVASDVMLGWIVGQFCLHSSIKLRKMKNEKMFGTHWRLVLCSWWCKFTGNRFQWYDIKGQESRVFECSSTGWNLSFCVALPLLQSLLCQMLVHDLLDTAASWTLSAQASISVVIFECSSRLCHFPLGLNGRHGGAEQGLEEQGLTRAV